MKGAWAAAGDPGDPLQKGHVLGMLAKFVISDQGTVRRPSENVVFGGVNLLEKGTLVEFLGSFQIAKQLLL